MKVGRVEGGKITRTLAVDTGGTFTDFVLLEKDGEGGVHLRTLKLPSTPHDPAAAVLEGISLLIGTHREADDSGDRWALAHGSTVATNALLEGRGARVVLITNRGFEDVIEIGRQARPQLYALEGTRGDPPVPRDARIGIAGRLAPDGSEVQPLDPEEVAALPGRVRALGAEAVAVVLLHSYAERGHEEEVGRSLRTLPIPVSLSSRVLPEHREFERTSTTVVNAAVTPLMARYLGRLGRESGAAHIRIMGSGGGSLSVERASAEPVQTVLSGPAGGVAGALARAREAGWSQVLTFDMGGTSTDVALCPVRPSRTREFSIAGIPVAIPVLDLHTVGAGGGSIARLDSGGILRVGPESSGALPGPICYGLGGMDPTVTDANVWLGRLPVEAFLGGTRRIDRERIREALEALAVRLDRSPEEAAEGILEIADATMERALRVISVERGHDPVDFTLVSFGGAGGLHAASLGSRIGIRRILIPPSPGLLSAWGMLSAPPMVERARTLLASTADRETTTRVDEVLDALAVEATERLVAEGSDPEEITIRRWVDARFAGQGFELTVEADRWREEFLALHRTRYGHARTDLPIEVVAVRVEAYGSSPAIPSLPLREGSGPAPSRGTRCWIDGRWREIPLHQREDLGGSDRLEGPAIVSEYSATTWIPGGWCGALLPGGGILLTPSDEGPGSDRPGGDPPARHAGGTVP